MSTLHDLMASSIDGRAVALGAADASPAGATRGLIARRRRRNAAVAGGSSALAIGALFAAVVTRDRADTAPATSSLGGIEYVTVDANGTSELQRFSDSLFFTYCGNTLPSPLTHDQGFSQSVAVDPSAPDGTLRIDATLRYDGPDRAPAAINTLGVLTRDGVILDFYRGSGPATPFGAVTSGETWEASGVVGGSLFKGHRCAGGPSTETGPDVVAYPAGAYQVYVVSQAVASPPLIAELELQAQGYFVAPNGVAGWHPGSIDCRQAVTSAGGGVTPVQCLDPLPPGVTIDEEAVTATLPYHLANYPGELNVILISQPITVTLDHDLTFADLSSIP